MTMRDKWQAVKKANEKTLGKNFFGHLDLGPLLEKAERAEADYDKLSGRTDEATLKKAKKKVYDAYLATDKPVAVYLKNIAMARKANAGNKEMIAALEKVEDELSMNIANVTNKKLKLFKSR